MARPKNDAIEQLMQSEGISRRTAMRRLADVRKLGCISPGTDMTGKVMDGGQGRFSPIASAGELRDPLTFITQREFDALVERVDKLEKSIGDRLNAKQATRESSFLKAMETPAPASIFKQGKEQKEGQRHPTLGERSSKNELPRRI